MARINKKSTFQITVALLVASENSVIWNYSKKLNTLNDLSI